MSKKSKGCCYTAFYVLCCIAFIIYMYAVMHITIISREPENKRISIDLLYSYRQLFGEKNYFYFDMIFLNIAMLIPFGILVPIIFRKADNALKVITTGFVFSLSIETMQYITGRGLFELDDLLNNTIGSAFGYIILVILRKIFVKNSDSEQKKT